MRQYKDGYSEIKEVVLDLLHNELRPELLQAIQSAAARHLSRAEAARMLGVSIQTIAKLITEGTLSAVRVRRRVLIPQSAITAYLRSREVDGSKGGK